MSNKQYRITVGGKVFEGGDNELNPEPLVLHSHVDLVGRAELTITRAKAKAWRHFQVGSALRVKVKVHDVPFEEDQGEVSWGPRTNGETFHGIITSLRYSRDPGEEARLTVIAHDALHFLRSTRTTRSWVEELDENGAVKSTVTDLDAVTTVLGAERNGVSIFDGQADNDAPQTPRRHIWQHAESDLTFLRRLAARNGQLLLARPSDNPEKFPFGVVDFTKPGFARRGDATVLRDRPHIEHLDYTVSPLGVPNELAVLGRNDKERTSVVLATATAPEVYGDFEDVPSLWYGSSALDSLIVQPDLAETIANAEIERRTRNVVRGRAVLSAGFLWPTTTIRFAGHRLGAFNFGAWVVGCRFEVSELYPGGRCEIAFCANAQAQ